MSSIETNFDLDHLAKQLWAIGDPVRLQILRILPTTPTCENACNVSKIAKLIGLSQPATSHHLRILRQAGIITNEKKCRDMIYWVQLDEASAVTNALCDVLGIAQPAE
jgi:ArsR family transcriptional regulator, arsenate/arsenite/antimonite-responsive transcriptional repressor